MKSISKTDDISITKFVKLPLISQQKGSLNYKKVFTRKPLNTSQNSSRILSSRLKTLNSQYNEEQVDEQQNNKKNDVLKKSKTIKFVSSKSSKSLEKLFECQSFNRLPKIKIQSQKQQSFAIINNSNNNNLVQSFQFNNIRKRKKQFHTNYDNQKQYFDLKNFVGSTELSQNDNVGNQQKNKLNQNSLKPQNQDYSSSFNSSVNCKSDKKQCTSCLILKQKLKMNEERNQQLQVLIVQKNKEILNYEQKISKLQKCLKETENFKNNLEYQMRLLKQKESLIVSQKQQIQTIYKKLQIHFSKMNQEIRYKDMQINIGKIYKSKAQQMQLKVESLNGQIKKLKEKERILKSSRSQILFKNRKRQNEEEDNTIYGKLNLERKKGNGEEWKLKHPKLTRVYSQDSIFSLSQQEYE